MNYINLLKGKLRKLENRLLDYYLGIDCGPRYNRPSKEIHDAGYIASSYRSLRVLIKQSLKNSDGTKLNFYDMGCGLGRACFYAEHLGVFNQVVGVEFDGDLIQLANKFNKRGKIQFVAGNAKEFKVKTENNLIYLANPFSGEVLNQFILNNLDILNTSYIAYNNDCFRDVLNENNLKPTWEERNWRLSVWSK